MYNFRMSLVALLVLSLISSLSPCSGKSELAENEEVSVSWYTYQRILDLAFPRPTPDLKKYAYRMVLRYEPSFGTESQIIILKLREGGFRVIHQTVNDVEGISMRLAELRTLAGTEDAEKMAKLIRINETELTARQNEIGQLVREYSNLRLPAALDEAITVDGGAYKLWYETPSNSLHFALAGSLEGASSRDHPLVVWMAKVRRTLSHPKQSDRAR